MDFTSVLDGFEEKTVALIIKFNYLNIISSFQYLKLIIKAIR